MTKSKAIALARQHIHMSPLGHGYVITQPYRWDDLSGPVYEGLPRDYWVTRYWLTRLRAEFALHLMGSRIHLDSDGGTLLDIVNRHLPRKAA